MATQSLLSSIDARWRLAEARVLTGRISIDDFFFETEQAPFRAPPGEYASLSETESLRLGVAKRAYFLGLVTRLESFEGERQSDRESMLRREILIRLPPIATPDIPEDERSVLVVNQYFPADPRAETQGAGPQHTQTSASPIRKQARNLEWSALESEDSALEPECRGISPFAYLRSMWTLFWVCILHPFTPTAIDLSTGRAIPPEEAHASASSDDLD